MPTSSTRAVTERHVATSSDSRAAKRVKVDPADPNTPLSCLSAGHKGNLAPTGERVLAEGSDPRRLKTGRGPVCKLRRVPPAVGLAVPKPSPRVG